MPLTVRFCRATLVVIVLLGGLLSLPWYQPGAVAFHDNAELQKFYTHRSQSHLPGTDGTSVVWTAVRNHPEDPTSTHDEPLIMGASRSAREPFVIAEREILPNSVDVDGNLVVWSEGTWTIDGEPVDGIVYSISLDGEMVNVIASGEGQIDNIGVWQGWIVWRSQLDGVTRLRLHDLGSAETITLAQAPNVDYAPGVGVPVIDAGWIAWTEAWDDEIGTFNRLVAMPVDRQDQAIQIDSSDGWSYDMAGGMLVYALQTELPAGWEFWDPRVEVTRVLNLNNDVTRDIETTMPPYCGRDNRVVATDGRFVFRSCVTRLGGSSGQDYAIHAYDLATDVSFPVFSGTSISMRAADGLVTWISGVGTTRSVHAAEMQDRLPSAPVPDDRPANPGWQYFPETGHYLQLGFKAFWERSGGLPVFGYPLTEEFHERNRDSGLMHPTQYTERQRYEWHPENTGTAYEVLLGRLGYEQAERENLLASKMFRFFTENERPDGDCVYFATTGHFACDAFLSYWQAHGLDLGEPGNSDGESLALFGYPISEPFTMTNGDGHTVLTQYFERAVFEWHPDNPAEYRVLLRRLGAEMMEARGW